MIQPLASARIAAGVLVALFLCAAQLESERLVDVQRHIPGILVDLRYATADNLAHRALYPPEARCLLRREVADRLADSLKALQAEVPAWTFLVKDCYRPPSAQRALYDALKKTNREGYVTDPRGTRSAVHTFGAAVDLTLATTAGVELDLGTPYDALTSLAQPRHEDYFLRTHELGDAAFKRRQILRRAMLHGKFRPIPNEWWHFDRWRGKALRARYEAIVAPMVVPEDSRLHKPSLH